MTKYYINNIEVSQEQARNLIPISITEERVDLRQKNNFELVQEYKQKLRETDYKAIKYAEGLISETDYAPIKAERENYRKAINSLEISLK